MRDCGVVERGKERGEEKKRKSHHEPEVHPRA
jgi:hypothetical protein